MPDFGRVVRGLRASVIIAGGGPFTWRVLSKSECVILISRLHGNHAAVLWGFLIKAEPTYERLVRRGKHKKYLYKQFLNLTLKPFNHVAAIKEVIAMQNGHILRGPVHFYGFSAWIDNPHHRAPRI